MAQTSESWFTGGFRNSNSDVPSDLGYCNAYFQLECVVLWNHSQCTHKFYLFFTFFFIFPFPQILICYFSSLALLFTFLPLFISILSLFFLWQNDTTPHTLHTVDAVCPADPSWIKELTPLTEGYWLLMVYNPFPLQKLSSAEGSYLTQGYTPPWEQPRSKKSQSLCLNLKQLWRTISAPKPCGGSAVASFAVASWFTFSLRSVLLSLLLGKYYSQEHPQLTFCKKISESQSLFPGNLTFDTSK